MDDFLRRLTRVHRRDLPVEPAEPPSARSSSTPSRLLDYLISSTTTATTSPDYPGINFTLPNDTSTATSFPGSTMELDAHVRSNEAFPLSSFAVIKAVVLAIVLGILLLTSCRVVGKIICKNSSKDQAEQ